MQLGDYTTITVASSKVLKGLGLQVHENTGPMKFGRP